MAIAWGHAPVVPRVVATPSGVILVMEFDPSLAVKTLPARSRMIPSGCVPVLASTLETPSGVILVTVLSR
jgi:hypothetical protein